MTVTELGTRPGLAGTGSRTGINPGRDAHTGPCRSADVPSTSGGRLGTRGSAGMWGNGTGGVRQSSVGTNPGDKSSLSPGTAQAEFQSPPGAGCCKALEPHKHKEKSWRSAVEVLSPFCARQEELSAEWGGGKCAFFSWDLQPEANPRESPSLWNRHPSGIAIPGAVPKLGHTPGSCRIPQGRAGSEITGWLLPAACSCWGWRSTQLTRLNSRGEGI